MPADRIDLQDLERRARRAYERGRLRRALLEAWPVIGLMTIALALGSRPGRVLGVAAALFVIVVIALHRGRASSRAVVPGLLGGSLPMLAGLLSCRLPHACGGAGCTERCMVVCLVAAALGGAFIARRCRTIVPGGREPIVAAAAIAALTGGLGCVVLGTAGILGLAIGLATIAVPAVVIARAR